MQKLFILNLMFCTICNLQPMINNHVLTVQPLGGGSIGLTQEQVNVFDFFLNLQEGVSEISVVSLLYSQESFRQLLLLLTVENGFYELSQFSVEQLIEIIRIANYLGLNKDTLKVAIAKRFAYLVREVSWPNYEKDFQVLVDFFRGSGGEEIFEHAVLPYLTSSYKPLGLRKWNPLYLSPDGTMFMTLFRSWNMKVGDPYTGKSITSLLGDDIRWWRWSPDSTKIALVNMDNNITIHQIVPHHKKLIKFLGGEETVSDVKWSPDSTMLAGICGECAQIWDATTGKALLSVVHNGNEVRLDWLPTSDRIMITSLDDQEVRIWDVTQQKVLYNLTLAGNVGENHISPDGKKLAVKEGYSFQIIDLSTGEPSQLFWQQQDSYGISKVMWAPVGDKLAILKGDHSVEIWDVVFSQLLFTIPYCSFGIMWSPIADKIANAFDKEVVEIWDVTTGQRMHMLSEHDCIFDLKWSEDGTKLLVKSRNGKLWDIKTGKCLHTFNYGEVNDLHWLNDGSVMSSGEEGVTVLPRLNGIEQKLLTLRAIRDFCSEDKIKMSRGSSLKQCFNSLPRPVQKQIKPGCCTIL